MCNLFKAYANLTRSIQTAHIYVRILIRAFAVPSNNNLTLCTFLAKLLMCVGVISYKMRATNNNLERSIKAHSYLHSATTLHRRSQL